jgi:hypothetical protein
MSRSHLVSPHKFATEGFWHIALTIFSMVFASSTFLAVCRACAMVAVRQPTAATSPERLHVFIERCYIFNAPSFALDLRAVVNKTLGTAVYDLGASLLVKRESREAASWQN